MYFRTLTFAVISAVLLAAWAPSFAQDESEEEALRPVLLVIDAQNIWMPMMAEEDVASAPDKINESIAFFREHGYPVIAVYHTDPERGPEPGSEPFEFPDSIAIAEGDVKIVKNYPSSFVKTDLEEILREGKYNVAALCGLSATGCVLATYFGAMERDITAFMVSDALLSPDSEHTKMIGEICYSMTVDEMIERLEAMSQE